MKKTLINWLGLLGSISFLSYILAVAFSPLAYPGYDWKSQAVSDLMASDSPSRVLWEQLSSLYSVCGMISIMMVCVYIQGRLDKTLQLGVYLFAMMNWVSAVGYRMFPLSDSEYITTFQNTMHIVVTVAVIVLSIVSLAAIMVGGYKNRQFRTLAIWATVALICMCVGAIGVNVVPPTYFGIPARFSVFAATGFNAVLGIYLFRGFGLNGRTTKITRWTAGKEIW